MDPYAGERRALEERFAAVFEHLGLVIAYLRRRGAEDPEAIAGEVMTLAWRRLADVPADDPRPWLIATARNMLLAQWRRKRREREIIDALGRPQPSAPPAPALELDPDLEEALRRLSTNDREALLLVAWEGLSPSAAAASIGISPSAFRVRLYRARRRLLNALPGSGSAQPPAPLNPRPRSPRTTTQEESP